jgi:hypothetical protein
MTTKMTTINLYGEDGFAIHVNLYGDIVPHLERGQFGPVAKVIGHDTYLCSTEEAEQKILAEYQRRKAANV